MYDTYIERQLDVYMLLIFSFILAIHFSFISSHLLIEIVSKPAVDILMNSLGKSLYVSEISVKQVLL